MNKIFSRATYIYRATDTGIHYKISDEWLILRTLGVMRDKYQYKISDYVKYKNHWIRKNPTLYIPDNYRGSLDPLLISPVEELYFCTWFPITNEKLPNNIKKLGILNSYLDTSQLDKLYPNDINALIYHGNQEPNFIPNTIRELELHTNDLNCNKTYLPTELQKLNIKTKILKNIEYVPELVDSLVLDFDLSDANVIIPNSVSYLKIGKCEKYFDPDINIYNNYRINTENEFINVIPSQFKFVLNSGTKLKTLILGQGYNYIPNKNITKLDYLAVSYDFNQDLSFLEYVDELRLGRYITTLPKKVRVLTLFGDLQETDYIPDNIEELYLLGKYTIGKNTLPKTLKKLFVNHRYSESINLNYIPPNTYYENEETFLKNRFYY